MLLVHGIRTFGDWTERLARLLHEQEPDVEVQHFRYGYFSAIAFLVPFVRGVIVRRLRRHLADHAEDWRDVRVDIVAHSFGTYVTAWALRSLAPARRPSIHTVLLCGSVLRPSFPWNDLVGRGKAVRRVVNDCGEADWWPVISEIFVLGTGIAGRSGFTGIVGADVGIVNRYFAKVDHGGFFKQEFMLANWIPVLTSDAGEFGEEVIPPRRFWLIAELEHYAEAWKLALWLLIVTGPLWYWQNLAAENARAAAGRHMAEASSLLYRDPHLAVVRALQGLAIYDRWSAEPGALDTANAVFEQAWSTVQARQAAVEKANEAMQHLTGFFREVSVPLTDLRPMQVSSDGRYLLLPVIGRSPEPRGGLAAFDIYLWDNVELRMTWLSPPAEFPHASNFEVNYYDLDEAAQRVVLTRRFYVTFYDLDGEEIETYNASAKPRGGCYITKDSIIFAASLAGSQTIVLSDSSSALWFVSLASRCAPEPVVEMLTEEPVADFIASPGGDLGIIVHSDGTASLWLIRKASLLPIEHEVTAAAFRPGVGNELMTLGRDGKVILWQVSGKKLTQLHSIALPGEKFIYAKFIENGASLVALTADGKPGFWDAQTGTLSWTTNSRTRHSTAGQPTGTEP